MFNVCTHARAALRWLLRVGLGRHGRECFVELSLRQFPLQSKPFSKGMAKKLKLRYYSLIKFLHYAKKKLEDYLQSTAFVCSKQEYTDVLTRMREYMLLDARCIARLQGRA
jgi:hypothetical protein